MSREVDELKSQVEALVRERDDANAAIVYKNEVARAHFEQLEQAEARADQAAADLRAYGRHQEGCSAQFNGQSDMTLPPPCPPYRCRCGWDVAAQRLRATPTSSPPRTSG